MILTHFAYFNLNLIDIVIAMPVLALFLAVILRHKFYKISLVLAVVSLALFAFPHLTTSGLANCRAASSYCPSVRASQNSSYLFIVFISFILSITAILLAFIGEDEKHIVESSNKQIESASIEFYRSSSLQTVFVVVLSIIELLSLGVAGLAAISILFGVGIPIEIALWFFLVMNYKAIKTIRRNQALDSKRFNLYFISIILAGIACGFSGWVANSFGHIDTTGKPTHQELVNIVVAVIVFEIILLSIAMSWQVWPRRSSQS